MTDDELLEALAALEHQQWRYWTENVAESHDIPDELREKWEGNWRPYDELTDDVQEHDRKWARKALEIIQDHD